MILQNLNLRLLRSQILPCDLKMWQSALSQAQKKTAQIATIEICTVFNRFMVGFSFHIKYNKSAKGITKGNIDKEHICCAMSGKQSLAKKQWLKDRFDEGLVFDAGNSVRQEVSGAGRFIRRLI